MYIVIIVNDRFFVKKRELMIDFFKHIKNRFVSLISTCMIIGKIRICTVQGHEMILILFFKQHENYIKQKRRYGGNKNTTQL